MQFQFHDRPEKSLSDVMINNGTTQSFFTQNEVERGECMNSMILYSNLHGVD